MNHLEYKDTNNKAFKTYYDKFKKMVKQDLDGDGWFLLVKDFPFKPEEKGQKFNPQIMFTAGEDIGKWPSKNLVSLYGKTQYIVGRCRKKGPVLTLLDFQEGDYVKTATESGLRKELKEYFKGTGVSVRVYKSLKVTEKEPEVTEEDLADTGPEAETQPQSTEAGSLVEVIEVPAPKPSSVKEAIGKLVAQAEKLGVKDNEEFITLMTNFQKAVPRAPMMKVAIGKLNSYFEGLASQPQATSSGTADTGALEKLIEEAEKEMQSLEKEIREADTEVSRLEKVLEEQDKERDGLLEKAREMVESYNEIVDEDTEEARKRRFALSKDSLEILKGKIPALTQEIQKTEAQWEKAIDHLIDRTLRIEEVETSHKENKAKLETIG